MSILSAIIGAMVEEAKEHGKGIGTGREEISTHQIIHKGIMTPARIEQEGKSA